MQNEQLACGAPNHAKSKGGLLFFFSFSSFVWIFVKCALLIHVTTNRRFTTPSYFTRPIRRDNGSRSAAANEGDAQTHKIHECNFLLFCSLICLLWRWFLLLRSLAWKRKQYSELMVTSNNEGDYYSPSSSMIRSKSIYSASHRAAGAEQQKKEMIDRHRNVICWRRMGNKINNRSIAEPTWREPCWTLMHATTICISHTNTQSVNKLARILVVFFFFWQGHCW